MTADLQNPIFQDDDKAREALEAVRWPRGPYCPHCGATDRLAKVEGTKQSHRPGLHYCNHCKGQFTVTVGTVFERSKVSLSKWWLAVHLMASSKKGVSSHQLHRMLGVSYKTAWFMSHRIREAMKAGSFDTPLGGTGKTVEADETYIGRKKGFKKGRAGAAHKNQVVSLVERNGKVRSRHVTDFSAEKIRDIVVASVDPKSDLMTDESSLYLKLNDKFARHGRVNHSSKEYVSALDRTIHTNTVEGLLLSVQARHERHLSALRRAAFAPLPRRVRFSPQQPHRSRLQ